MATLTHARLRAEQGDVAGARRILGRILEADPEHREARTMLGSLGHGAGGLPERDRVSDPAGRARRLRRWLRRVRMNARTGGRHA